MDATQLAFRSRVLGGVLAELALKDVFAFTSGRQRVDDSGGRGRLSLLAVRGESELESLAGTEAGSSAVTSSRAQSSYPNPKV